MWRLKIQQFQEKGVHLGSSGRLWLEDEQGPWMHTTIMPAWNFWNKVILGGGLSLKPNFEAQESRRLGLGVGGICGVSSWVHFWVWNEVTRLFLGAYQPCGNSAYTLFTSRRLDKLIEHTSSSSRRSTIATVNFVGSDSKEMAWSSKRKLSCFGQ